MFTGLVSDVGEVIAVTDLDQGKRFRVKSSYDTSSIDLGASICHSGVCLTVVEKGDNWFEVEAWEEALRLSTLSELAIGDKINLERSLKIGDELGGHLVFGHVDGTAPILDIRSEGDASRFVLQAPEPVAKFIAEKGSITLDGTSLTVNRVDGLKFDILLIKHTLEVTTWGSRKIGDEVNVEVDQMARYAERLAQFR